MFKLFKLYRYATPLDIFLLILGVLSAIATGILQPLSTLLFGNLTGDLIKFAADLDFNVTSDAMEEKFMDSISKFAIYNSLIGLGMLVLSYLQTELFNFAALRQIYKIRSLYMAKILNQDIAWYDVHQTGDFASRMSDDLTKFEEGIGEKVPMFINSQSVFVSSLILSLVKGWKLALICLVSLPVSMMCIGIIAILSQKIAKRELDAYGAAGAIAEEVFGSLRTVLAFGGQQLEAKRYDERLTEAKNNNIKRQFMTALGFGLLWFFIYASYALAFWYGVKLVLEDRGKADPIYDPANMITVFFCVMTGSMNFGISSPYIEAFSVARAAGCKIYEVIDNEPIVNASKNVGEKLANMRGNITFKNVHFRYPSRKDIPILTGLDLDIKAGDTVALVGSSGCGKSTCVQLIQRFYDPESGTVEMDGVNIKKLDLTWLRSNIGVVGQEPVLFGTTIYENIKYGNPEATKEAIEAAAKKANAHEFIANLPHKYDTLVGERGAQLSGGQKQRIAIARALVRNPTVLLLDEATSALDTNSEAKVQAAIDSASKECTTVIVAHRLSTIKNATKIVVISKGKVVEQGTHSELMAKQAEYHKLVTSQVSAENETAAGDDRRIIQADDNRKESVSEDDEFNTDDSSKEKEEYVKASIWSILKLNSPEWAYILVGCISAIIMGFSMPVFAVLMGNVIGVLKNPDADYVTKHTNNYVILFVVAGIISGLATFLQIYMFSIAGEKLTMRVRSMMFTAMLRQEMGWYDRKENGVGALCSRLSGEAAHVQGATGQRIGTILQSLATLGLAIGLSMYYQWKLGLVALSFTPFILVATFFSQRLLNVENESHHKSLQSSTKIAVEAISNVRTVVSLGCEDRFHDLYMEHLDPHHKRTLRNTHVRALVLGLSRSLMFFAYATCMYYGGVLIKERAIEFDDVIKVSQALIMGSVSIANALAFSPNFQKGLTAAGKVLKLVNRIPKIRDAPNAINKEWEKGDIQYCQVFFAYPTRPNTLVLRGLDLSVLQGKTVALVGQSGCGKSTIIQLIERFYDPLTGEVMADQEDIRTISLASLRAHLGIVSQEPNLFDRTIEQNIAYGANHRVVSLDEVMDAARNANIHEFITNLPLGYNTRLGEKGTQLSGGQKQRVAIARALVRNPRILLLDEATSALDTESEKIVQEALEKAKQGRTCITIAHRLTTIQDADVICVVHKGRVAEMGSHSELLSRKGLYHRLHTLQHK